MKKFFVIMIVTLFVAGFSGCSKYDDSNLWDSVNSLEAKLTALEAKVNQMNTEIGSIKELVDALNAQKKITNVATTATGHTITFSDNSVITLNHGANGTNGTNGTNGADGAKGADAPVIGVGADDGVYYWTISSGGTTSWLLDAQNNKLPVSGVTPVIGIDADGYWTVNGAHLTGADGNPVKASGEDGDSFFSDVSQDENAVTFTLTDGTVIVIPKAENLSIITDITTALFIKYGETQEYDFTLSGTGSVIITKPDGWKATLKGGTLSITAPPVENTFAEKDGDISVTVVGKNTTVSRSFAVSARDYNYVIDFEDPRVTDYLAGPTAHGENLYSSYAGDDRYFGYDDAGSGLFMLVNESLWSGEIDFFGGGIAISQWNNMGEASWDNQCSVYYSDATTGKGGYKGSETFAVGYGYNDYRSMGDSRSIISFQNGQDECVFDHFYVTNSAWAAIAMQSGSYPATAFTDGDWFKLVIEGFDKNGEPVGTVEFYLADFRTPTSPGIITEWTPVDLSSLGSVSEIKFDLQSSDVDPMFGMNTPGYFCFDNLAIKK
jgi:outer membrane murein-binding lipoprotein Lpp